MIEHYKHPKKNDGHVFDLCFICFFRSIFGRPAVSKACKPCSKLSWPRSDGQKTLEFQGQPCDDFCALQETVLANCWENCWEKPCVNVLYMMAYYYDLLLCIHFSYHCDENERRRMRDRIKSTSAVLFASSCHNFSAKPLRMLGVP